MFYKVLGKIDVKSEISHLKHLEFDKGMREAIKKVVEINFLNISKGQSNGLKKLNEPKHT